MNNLPKIVFSRTLQTVEWQNARLATGNLSDEIAALKGQPGGDMVIYGSGTLVAALTQLGLIDEYQIFVNPLILGVGRPLFAGLTEQLNLKLLKAQAFKSGSVLLCYQTER